MYVPHACVEEKRQLDQGPAAAGVCVCVCARVRACVCVCVCVRACVH